MIKNIMLYFALTAFFFCCSDFGKKSGEVIVQIDFGQEKNEIIQAVTWNKNTTALEALQKVAPVHTYVVSEYVIVTEIDSIKGKRGEMAWYYKINGKLADKLAINNQLNPGDTVTWIYKTDVCSATVDPIKNK